MKYGLIGEKLGHSFSKIIHEELAEYTYDLIPLTRNELKDFMTKKEFQAINVTIPYKELVIPYLDEVDPKATAIGAVNTVVNRKGRLWGYNTDYFGFLYMLKKNGIDPQGKKVLVLGKGGAAKAVIAVLQDLQAKEILSVYYKEEKGNWITYEECLVNHSDATIIINTTPVGMFPKAEETPLGLDGFPKLEAVVDVIYNPLRTQLVLEGERRGIKSIGGLEMLIAQAKYAVEIFLDILIDDGEIHRIYLNVMKEQSNLVLIGMSGAGKTVLGQAAAKALGKIFVDSDEEILKEIQMPIAEYFETRGEVAFRQIEKQVIAHLSVKNNLLISTGGGVVKDQENIQALKRNGRILWLQREPSLLESGKGRPLVPNQEAAIKLYQERIFLYGEAEEATVENNGSEEEGVSAICQAFLDFLR